MGIRCGDVLVHAVEHGSGRLVLVPDAIALLDQGSYHSFDVGGVARVFALRVDDTGWSIERRDGDVWQRSAVAFSGPDLMDSTGENSSDQGATWQHDFAISYARRG